MKRSQECAGVIIDVSIGVATRATRELLVRGRRKPGVSAGSLLPCSPLSADIFQEQPGKPGAQYRGKTLLVLGTWQMFSRVVYFMVFQMGRTW